VVRSGYREWTTDVKAIKKTKPVVSLHAQASLMKKEVEHRFWQSLILRAR